MNRKEDMVYSIVSPEKNAPSNTDDNTTQPTPDWNTEANVETLAYSDTQITSSDCHSQSKSEETPDVRHAVKSRDWQLLRQLSCHPGGFGKDRVYAWPYLLGVDPDDIGHDALADVGSGEPSTGLRRRPRKTTSESDVTRTGVASLEIKPTESDEHTAEDSCKDDFPAQSSRHPDEHQIKLDTDRSFVLYPVEHHANREELQHELNTLITSVFRRRPRLSYFQGFHDIITVLFLTLPPELQLVCAEKVSLYRLRDAMGKGLEPMLGLLRILKYLFRLADPGYAEVLEQNTPLPYFALSNLLTLFSHDVPTLPQIQHVFDYLLCRPPIYVVYLVAAVTLARKDEVMRMVDDDEDGMLHSLLTTLPDFEDVEGEGEGPSKEDVTKQEDNDGSNILEDLQDRTRVSVPTSDEKVLVAKEDEQEMLVSLAGEFDDYSTTLAAVTTKTASEPSTTSTPEVHTGKTEDSESELDGSAPISSSTATISGVSEDSQVLPPSLPSVDSLSQTPPSSASPSPSSKPNTPDRPRTPEPTPVSLPSLPTLSPTKLEHKRKKPTTPLISILIHADTLYDKYPPSHPDLHIAEIMGPASVIFTWKQPSGSLSYSGSSTTEDDEAERLVTSENVVLPYEDSEAEADIDDSEWEELEKKEPATPTRKRRRLTKRRPNAPTSHRHRPSRLRKTLRRLGFASSPLLFTDKKTVTTGAVLVLGVAVTVAVYSMQTRNGANGNGGNGVKGLLDLLNAATGVASERGSAKAGKWIVGTVLGGSEKLLETFGWSR